VLQAERLGVTDLFSLPVRREDFDRVLHRLQTASDERAIPLPPVQPDLPGTAAMVGQHASMLEVYKLIARVAPSLATVLILGESGTGKEVVARAIHLNGSRAAGPFIAVNCAAIPDNLLESELFGHERGAFTGAVARRAGRFELAVGGTLFLDEIADLSMVLQAKILRAVQEHEIERVGGGETIPVDVRVIAATNQDLRGAIDAGRFREDLYYRLAVVTINLPRLVDRGEDLLLLTAYFATYFGRLSGKHISTISDRALDLLRSHKWAGNVRELRNVIERAVIVSADDSIRVANLPDEFRGAGLAVPKPTLGAMPTLAEVEARHIARALAHTGGVIGSAAALLGIHRNTLSRKIAEHGL
jgi:DNA-binding NtrC family response regulator